MVLQRVMDARSERDGARLRPAPTNDALTDKRAR
jgi:hypothetical protein